MSFDSCGRCLVPTHYGFLYAFQVSGRNSLCYLVTRPHCATDSGQGVMTRNGLGHLQAKSFHCWCEFPSTLSFLHDVLDEDKRWNHDLKDQESTNHYLMDTFLREARGTRHEQATNLCSFNWLRFGGWYFSTT